MAGKFKCFICGCEEGICTGKHPRDRQDFDIIKCKNCGHIQMFPLLSKEEYDDEYDNDKSVMAMLDRTEPMASDFERIRFKNSEMTKIHVDMYWDILQRHKRILNLGSGYGFFEEECNKRDDRKFKIEGVEIGRLPLENYVGGGGGHYTMNFLYEEVPENLLGKFDLIICMHLLEHLSEPIKYLNNIKPLLSSDGEVLFEVPNTNCFLAELSSEYNDFMYMYEHVSYYYDKTLKLVFEKAGYKVTKIYTKETYSIENHIRWIRDGKPFTKYNQVYLPDNRIEFINKEYKKAVEDMGKGYALIIEAKP